MKGQINMYSRNTLTNFKEDETLVFWLFRSMNCSKHFSQDKKFILGQPSAVQDLKFRILGEARFLHQNLRRAMKTNARGSRRIVAMIFTENRER